MLEVGIEPTRAIGQTTGIATRSSVHASLIIQKCCGHIHILINAQSLYAYMTTCPSCNHENPDQAKFCMECGTPLPRSKQCGEEPWEESAGGP